MLKPMESSRPMYDFVDPANPSMRNKGRLQTTVAGVNLDATIQGFKTLAVYGRETQSRDIDEIKTSGPKRFLRSKLQAKTIVLKYELVARDNRDFVEQFELLNHLLDHEITQWTFTDDPDFYYLGLVSEMDPPDVNALAVIGEIEIETIDAYKRRIDSETWEFETTASFMEAGPSKTEIEQMTIEVLEAGDFLHILNESTGFRLDMARTTEPGDVVTFDFVNGTITGEGGQSLMKHLALTSDFEDFGLNNLDVLRINPASKVRVIHREARL